MAAKAKPTPALTTVKALTNLAENSVVYKPGDTFQVTPERADSLGDAVEILESPPAE